MPHPICRANLGFTLMEALIAVMISVILMMLSHTIVTQLVPKYQVITAAHAINNFMLAARAGAMSSHNHRMLCSGDSGCKKFTPSRSLIVGMDANDNNELEKHEILGEYKLPGDTRLHWKRFRGNALVFNRYGISHFQNGSFYICNETAARRLVMNWIGRTRLETVPVSDCPN
ncbi:MAG: GspH/FimT family pseudopilin [Pseudomonadales bacterium]|uniref:Type II secretion system protein H n=1 Tax=Alcanivorax profundi TaxID=2338368 RepID=A0A418XTH2_9GAMM|nr:GspH/FimT family pseudopilin [Alcanivorax profundi]MCG8415805.1 GspH/FimT family pseudopilin [Pseudomonadales bacterium]RJG15961.1 hypothetical protein D4A39_15940 [Alcanivorax profundi]|tara:strand:- start:157 stop:675 length:519 start_codon:yes stop_codon:yes gene_type:complete